MIKMPSEATSGPQPNGKPLPSAQPIFIGQTPIQSANKQTSGSYCTVDGETFYKIAHYDQMPPFFMSIVSVADHWLFISSTGGLSAGRVNAESALFPYYTDDKLTENSDNTGHLAIFLVEQSDRRAYWQPFSADYADFYQLERNLYKNVSGDKLIFEEINHDLKLTYRYGWRSSNRFGFVKTSWLENWSSDRQAVALLDGLQNVLPYGATVALQGSMSNLLNAYKRSELDGTTGIGIFALNATLTDLAEPSESLKATTVWQTGLDQPTILLSSQQVEAFGRGEPTEPDTEIRGQRGAYLAQSSLTLAPNSEKSWHFVAEVNQDHNDLVTLRNFLAQDSANLINALETDIQACSHALRKIIASADGLQVSAETLTANHHFANVLFNTMRGGIFADNYTVSRDDVIDFLHIRNTNVLNAQKEALMRLPAQFNYQTLLELAAESDSADFVRLAYEYLPLTFSRRHGDPSRPWNWFSINISKPDGSQRLDYQGNWRDIFQNWEPLGWSYPNFIISIIAKFLNATTADGYNPYRVTRDGIEWEAPEPNDPWANIGYWSDHQIVYLHRLLNIAQRTQAGKLAELLDERVFSHANVPYRIKPYVDLLADGYNTIDFDHDLDEQIAHLVLERGSDAKLLLSADKEILHVNLAEKLLLLLLAKLANFVPEGGIWMITQRPEWNDANNALVGKGLSVVTLGYLYGYIQLLSDLLANAPLDTLEISSEVAALYEATSSVFEHHQTELKTGFSDQQRRAMMDELGTASSFYRGRLYAKGHSENFRAIDKTALISFLGLAQQYIAQSLSKNERADHLYHSYNTITLSDGAAQVNYLYEMLEGQVSILATGLLSNTEAIALLKNLRQSKLYRADQHSYMLYPDRDLPGFLEKNVVSAETLTFSKLIPALIADGNRDVMTRDDNGDYHFNASFRKANNLQEALDKLSSDIRYAKLISAEKTTLLSLFEEIFDHKSFTGRSGTFFAFEGLGSIYWHQVSKLLLATQETTMRAIDSGADPEIVTALVDAYYDIRSGIGFNKSPDVYGAFPTDPYSHTPAAQGAKQPGMTGQVKEEILTRMVELGVSVSNSNITLYPQILRSSEFSDQASTFDYIDVAGNDQTISLAPNTIAFTYCQVPIVYSLGDQPTIEVDYANGQTVQIAGTELGMAASRHLFDRDGQIRQLRATIQQENLR